ESLGALVAPRRRENTSVHLRPRERRREPGAPLRAAREAWHHRLADDSDPGRCSQVHLCDPDPTRARRRASTRRLAARSLARSLRLGRDEGCRMIRVPELIERKRDGGELSADELAELMQGYAQGEIPDYQLAAFCMAVFFRGLSSAETYALTDALIRTGETVDLDGALGREVVDKHSTGGVGDKT